MFPSHPYSDYWYSRLTFLTAFTLTGLCPSPAVHNQAFTCCFIMFRSWYFLSCYSSSVSLRRLHTFWVFAQSLLLSSLFTFLAPDCHLWGSAYLFTGAYFYWSILSIFSMKLHSQFLHFLTHHLFFIFIIDYCFSADAIGSSWSYSQLTTYLLLSKDVLAHSPVQYFPESLHQIFFPELLLFLGGHQLSWWHFSAILTVSYSFGNENRFSFGFLRAHPAICYFLLLRPCSA